MIIKFLIDNYLILIPIIYVVAEVITSLTPTKTDDILVDKLGKIIKLVFKKVKLPNNLK